MKVKALKDGFYNSRRKEGDVFEIDPKHFKGWMEKVKETISVPKKAEPKPDPLP
jgi:hypothetical protein